MNQNLIYKPSTANRKTAFSVRLSPMPFDEKAAFVHGVCVTVGDKAQNVHSGTRG